MRSMKAAEAKFRSWLARQPVGTEWMGEDVMQMMKGNKATELINIGAVRSLMARFSNVACRRDGINVHAVYWKTKEEEEE